MQHLLKTVQLVASSNAKVGQNGEPFYLPAAGKWRGPFFQLLEGKLVVTKATQNGTKEHNQRQKGYLKAPKKEQKGAEKTPRW